MACLYRCTFICLVRAVTSAAVSIWISPRWMSWIGHKHRLATAVAMVVLPGGTTRCRDHVSVTVFFISAKTLGITIAGLQTLGIITVAFAGGAVVVAAAAAAAGG